MTIKETLSRWPLKSWRVVFKVKFVSFPSWNVHVWSSRIPSRAWISLQITDTCIIDLASMMKPQILQWAFNPKLSQNLRFQEFYKHENMLVGLFCTHRRRPLISRKLSHDREVRSKYTSFSTGKSSWSQRVCLNRYQLTERESTRCTKIQPCRTYLASQKGKVSTSLKITLLLNSSLFRLDDGLRQDVQESMCGKSPMWAEGAKVEKVDERDGCRLQLNPGRG